MTVESTRKGAAWRFWGPYLAERQWGTVREDYSADGNAWGYFTHDAAISRAYRWGEDGLGGICDKEGRLCFAVALWNGQDRILKERLFGLTGSEGNHGEDVKELYYYLDSTPSHSYMKMLYKYPQRAFPYDEILAANRSAGKQNPEFELLDTGIFNEDRYWDIFVEYAKSTPDDILIKITCHNRGPETAELLLLPHLWFASTWSWEVTPVERPIITLHDKGAIRAHSKEGEMGDYFLYAEGDKQFLFCDNESNINRLYGLQSVGGYYKDAFHDFFVNGKNEAVNPSNTGTKACAVCKFSVAAGDSHSIRLRFVKDTTPLSQPFHNFEAIFSSRISEADEFYGEVQKSITDQDHRMIQRQAFAGMLWSKQYYHLDLRRWLSGDPAYPPPPCDRATRRNSQWLHMYANDIISMPDKWEYPWFAAWDLAFHCIPLAMIDPEFAKEQLLLLTREWYTHPNGQIPAYEWAFSDVNPPVHAWAGWRVYKMEKKASGGTGDLDFLERLFHKLSLNFTWWVNRKDTEGNNIFQGGFLGLDNIGVFDRSSKLPTGGRIEQADATAWMAMYALNMMRIALELASYRPNYQDMATKFFEHFLHIAEAMMNMSGGVRLWDPNDEFYYDVLHIPGEKSEPLRVRSLVGLIPLFAVEVLEPELLANLPDFKKRLEWLFSHRPELANLVSRWQEPGSGERRLLSLLRGHRMKKLLRRMLDETEFLSDFGIRGLSKYHLEHPYVYRHNSDSFSVKYAPAESDSYMFGGNSNWRGPIWFPVNFLLIESLQKFHHYYGNDFKVECPTGSGTFLTLREIANELTLRLCRLFERNRDGERPVFGDYELLQKSPHFRDYILFYEYFHGDSGRGVGAAHQTGWTGLIAKLIRDVSPAPPTN
jgi:hypothetical protein